MDSGSFQSHIHFCCLNKLARAHQEPPPAITSSTTWVPSRVLDNYQKRELIYLLWASFGWRLSKKWVITFLCAVNGISHYWSLNWSELKWHSCYGYNALSLVPPPWLKNPCRDCFIKLICYLVSQKLCQLLSIHLDFGWRLTSHLHNLT